MHHGVQAAEAARERELEAAEEAQLAAEQQRLRQRWRAEHAAEAARTAEAALEPGTTRPGPQARMSGVRYSSHARHIQTHSVTWLFRPHVASCCPTCVSHLIAWLHENSKKMHLLPCRSALQVRAWRHVSSHTPAAGRMPAAQPLLPRWRPMGTRALVQHRCVPLARPVHPAAGALQQGQGAVAARRPATRAAGGSGTRRRLLAE